MVRGLDVFRQYFAAHADQFVLIGGIAATLAMEDAGLEFRATKDLDIVLHIEALKPAFGEVFWKFVEEGGYEIRQASTGKPMLYRFQKPKNERFPAMLELFCRMPDDITLIDGSRLTPTRRWPVYQRFCSTMITTDSSWKAARNPTAYLGSVKTD